MSTRFAPLLLAAAGALVAALPAAAQAASPAQLAQQTKMKDCNAEAKTKALKGDARKTYMKTCLAGGTTATMSATPMAATAGPGAGTGAAIAPAPMSGPVPPVSPADRMKTCNAEAGTKALKGDARKSFMATCLKG